MQLASSFHFHTNAILRLGVVYRTERIFLIARKRKKKNPPERKKNKHHRDNVWKIHHMIVDWQFCKIINWSFTRISTAPGPNLGDLSHILSAEVHQLLLSLDKSEPVQAHYLQSSRKCNIRRRLKNCIIYELAANVHKSVRVYLILYFIIYF